MGGCGSHQIKEAVKRDGPDNVKKAAICRAGRRQAQRYYEELSKKYPDFLKEKQANKMKLIDQKKEDLEERQKEIHRKLQTQKPNSVQKLQARNKKPFKQIIGYNKTEKDIQTYRAKVKKTFQEQKVKLDKDVKTQSQRKCGDIQKSEPPCASLSRFGVDRKSKILKDQEGKYKDQIEANNKKIRDEIDKDFGCDQVYKQRFQSKAPDSELNQILKQFEQNVPSSSSMTGGCCS